MQRPLVFCDKSMYRPLDNVTIKRVGLVKRDRPVSRVLRARMLLTVMANSYRSMRRKERERQDKPRK